MKIRSGFITRLPVLVVRVRRTLDPGISYVTLLLNGHGFGTPLERETSALELRSRWKIMREWRAYPAVSDWGEFGRTVAGIAMAATRPRRYERMKWTSMIGKMPWIVGFQR